MTHAIDPRRRQFLLASGAAASGLVLPLHLGASAAGTASTPGLAAGGGGQAAPLVNAWIRIAPDDKVTIYTNITDMGQGTGSAIAQLVAEELDVAWEAIRSEMAPIEKAYYMPGDNYYTDGSQGVSAQFDRLRKAGAAARGMLVQAAASRWQVAPETCSAAAGAVTHGPSGRVLRYGALAEAAALLPVPMDPVLKKRADWRLIGTTPPRLDIPAKVDGSAVYGIDVRLPGMLVATIAHCPVFGGVLAALDDKPALAVRGVRKVVRLEGAVAVVADTYWQAQKGLAALKPEWKVAGAPRSSPALRAQLKASAERAVGSVFSTKTAEDSAAARAGFALHLAKGVRTQQSLYEFPFLAHATMEPMNGTAQVFADRAELWLPTQAQLDSRVVAAQELKLAPGQVTVNTTLCGGGFGRRDQVDFVLDAVRVARAMPGVPVKLIWSRAEDMQHGYYRPSCALRVSASLADDGLPATLHMHSSGTVIVGERPYLPFDRSKLGGRDTIASAMDFNPFSGVYGAGRMMITVADEDTGVPVGYWRSVGASQNAFALESFIDELANGAGADPLAYRHRLIDVAPDKFAPSAGMDPKMLARIVESRALIKSVLEAVVQLSGWDQPRAPGRFMGIAVGRPGGTYVAQVAEVSVDANKRVTIHAMSCAVDCGTAVNPQNIRAQLEGAMIYGLSAALFGAITIKDGRVEQSNFHDYPILTLAQTPQFRIQVLETSARVSGIGEAGTSLAGPAVANAIFAATGIRITSLPMTGSGFTFA